MGGSSWLPTRSCGLAPAGELTGRPTRARRLVRARAGTPAGVWPGWPLVRLARYNGGVNRDWHLNDVDENTTQRLAAALGVHPITARCLVQRGHGEVDNAGSFLNPRLAELRPPTGLAGFSQAVGRLLEAIVGGQRIGIFGDYDVDGVTTTALLTRFLRQVGAEVSPRVAQRDGGYGFSSQSAMELCENGAQLIVTVDCGTNDLEAIAAAKERGVDVVVVDHHQVPERSDHPACALVNPHRKDSPYPFRDFASVGLGFFMVAALRTALKKQGWFAQRKEPDVRQFLDLVAVGTVADMMPLVAENRILVTCGLKQLARRERPGLAALLAMAGVDRERELDESVIGWKIAPRLNAPGRLGDAAPALALMLADEPAEAERWAQELENANNKRREIGAEIAEQAAQDADEQSDSAAIVVARPGWLHGVVGIVAARLCDRLDRPCVVIAINEQTGEGRGSVRTVHDIDVHRALSACQHLLVRFGGHPQAAGLTIMRDKISEFTEAFCAAIAAQTDASCVAPGLELVAEVDLADVDDRLASELARFAPFGPGNEDLVVAVRGVRVRDSRRVGDGSHLKLTLEPQASGPPRSAIAFRMGDRDPGAGAVVDVACFPQISTWRGQRRVELRVHDLKEA